jgi:hypothetical protein
MGRAEAVFGQHDIYLVGDAWDGIVFLLVEVREGVPCKLGACHFLMVAAGGQGQDHQNEEGEKKVLFHNNKV